MTLLPPCVCLWTSDLCTMTTIMMITRLTTKSPSPSPLSRAKGVELSGNSKGWEPRPHPLIIIGKFNGSI